MLGKIEGRRRRRRGWMASPTPQTWVWGNAGSWWWTGRPGVLRSTGSQRVGQDWATELSRVWWGRVCVNISPLCNKHFLLWKAISLHSKWPCTVVCHGVLYLWPKMSKHRDISRNRHPNWTNQNLSVDLIYGFPLSLGPWAIKTRQRPWSLSTWENVYVELSQDAKWWLVKEVGRDRDRESDWERDRESYAEILHPTVFDFHSEPSNYVSQPILFKTYAIWLQFLSFETETHLD